MLRFVIFELPVVFLTTMKWSGLCMVSIASAAGSWGEILWVVLVVGTFAIPVRLTVAINDMARCTSDGDSASTDDDRIKVVISSGGKGLLHSASARIKKALKLAYGLALEGNGRASLELG